jgi:hypothetical protein
MLTDTQCRTAKAKDKPYKLVDGHGLFLEVKPNGVKAWRYRFELRNGEGVKESVFAIGEYVVPPRGETPEEAQARRNGRRLTLAEAREERVKARGLVIQGICREAAARPPETKSGACQHVRGRCQGMACAKGLGGRDQGLSAQYAFACGLSEDRRIAG